MKAMLRSEKLMRTLTCIGVEAGSCSLTGLAGDTFAKSNIHTARPAAEVGLVVQRNPVEMQAAVGKIDCQAPLTLLISTRRAQATEADQGGFVKVLGLGLVEGAVALKLIPLVQFCLLIAAALQPCVEELEARWCGSCLNCCLNDRR